MTLKALIFDVDGTLAETEELHRQAFNETFNSFNANRDWPDTVRGWNWDRDVYARLLKTTGGKERIAAYIRNDLKIDPAPYLDRIAQLHKSKTARFVRLLESRRLELRPGIEKIISEAKAAGLKLAIATTTSRANVEALSCACFNMEASGVFDAIVAGDEVAAKKPAPDVYQLALERLGHAPDECIAFEDSWNGVSSARAAGLFCIVAPSTYTREEDLSGADLLLQDFDCFSLFDLQLS
jgi:HAD superfamily hydrolase (TIGR01509 family)